MERGTRAWRRALARALVVLLMLGCGADGGGADGGGADGGGGGAPDAAAAPPARVGPADRPARLVAPAAHDGSTPRPLLVLLHGRGVDARGQDVYFGLTRRARTDGFYLLLPDGTLNEDGVTHWDVRGVRVDDHAYLRGVIEETLAAVPVDRSAVWVMGHSNGAFMAYRLACDASDLITGIAGLAGSDAVESCAPSADVAVLQMHGTADSTVLYDGGEIAGLTYPSTPEVSARWAARLGCDPEPVEGAPLDLIADVAGPETAVLDHGGCRAPVTLWRMVGVEHIPALDPAFTPAVLDWLRAHRR